MHQKTSLKSEWRPAKATWPRWLIWAPYAQTNMVSGAFIFASLINELQPLPFSVYSARGTTALASGPGIDKSMDMSAQLIIVFRAYNGCVTCVV